MLLGIGQCFAIFSCASTMHFQVLTFLAVHLKGFKGEYRLWKGKLQEVPRTPYGCHAIHFCHPALENCLLS